jgi:2-C-methyl-D-erythritol 4-phosphate cytidylyltransferase
MNLTIDAILLGAGLGRRFSDGLSSKEASVPKQFQLLNEVPVFIHPLLSLLSLGCFRQVIITVPKAYQSLAMEQVEKQVPILHRDKVRIVIGGERRQDSSRIALEAIEETHSLPDRVLIHDACRAYLSEELLQNIKNSLYDRSYGAWIPVVPVVDTLKRVENHQVVETIDRNIVHRVQTPQIFEYTVIRSLYEKLREAGDPDFTDDASLCEYYGIPVGAFPGDVRNIKLTYEFEKETLRFMLKETQCAPESDTTFTA